MGEAAVSTIPLDPESQKVLDWKMKWLLSGGFSKRNSELIATSKVDFRFAITTLHNAREKGYDEDFVIKLLL